MEITTVTTNQMRPIVVRAHYTELGYLKVDSVLTLTHNWTSLQTILDVFLRWHKEGVRGLLQQPFVVHPTINAYSIIFIVSSARLTQLGREHQRIRLLKFKLPVCFFLFILKLVHFYLILKPKEY